MRGVTTATSGEKKSKHQKEKLHIKDGIIGLVLLASLGLIVYSRLAGLPPEQWTGEIIGIVGDFSIYLIGIIGVFEFCYDNGVLFLVPDKFIDRKEESLRKQTKEYLYNFFDRESEFLERYEEGRLADALSMMGLSSQGYQHIKAKVLEARLAPMYDIETARSKMLDMIFYSDAVHDLHRDAMYVNTGDLRYYFKIHDLMHNKQQCDAIAQAMATFIALTCEQEGIDLSEIDVIMVPDSGNYLLGLSVSKLLSKRFIKMIPKKKQVADNRYEGIIPDKFSKKTVDVLIVHDVLLTGGQIIESANDLRDKLPNCNIHGLFSMVYRNVADAKNKLENGHNIKCYSLIELTEEEVEQELIKRAKS